MKYIHQDLAKGSWYKLSLLEQMSNVGSEISRTIIWKQKNQQHSQDAFYRALELLVFTLEDPKNKSRLKEIARTKEVLIDWYFGSDLYHTTNEQWQKYFLQFNLAVRLKT